MDKERLELGRKIRREVLGDKYVAEADKNLDTDDFIRPFREFTAEFLWGSIWSRPGLDRRTRVLLNIAMLTALGRTEELKIYFDCLDNVGLTKDDVREVLLHAAPYCGIPAALDAFRVAASKLK